MLGTYVELAINDESRLCNVADFKSQLAVCKALGAGCIGTETTAMSKQPAGTTRAQAQELLCRSLAEILPAAEALGVTVGIEPVTYHSMNSAAATRHILDTMRSPNLKVIFDMSNLVSAENVDTQDRIWYDMGTLLGIRSWLSISRGRRLRRTAACCTPARGEPHRLCRGVCHAAPAAPARSAGAARGGCAGSCGQRHSFYERIFLMAELERKTLVVDESGRGDYRTLTEAVAACAESAGAAGALLHQARHL